MKRFALLVAVVFAILLGFLLAWRLFEIILMFFASLALAAMLRTPIERFMDRGAPRGVAILAVYMLAGLGVLALLWVLYQRLGDELAALPEDLGFIYARLSTLGRSFGRFSPPPYVRFPTPEQLSELLVGGQLGAAVRPLMGFTQNLAGAAGNLGLILILSVYWTADRLRFERLALSLMPARQRGQARTIWHAIESGVGRYLRSELLQSFIAGFALAPVFLLLGLRYPVFWALAASVAWLVPLVGAFIVVVPLWIIVWVQSGALIATAAVVATLIVLAILEFFVEKRLYVHERDMNVLLLVVILLMASAYGLPGLLIAPPIAITINILLTELAKPRSPAPARPAGAGAGIAALQAELAQVQELVANTENGPRRRLHSLAERLAQLLEQARQV